MLRLSFRHFAAALVLLTMISLPPARAASAVPLAVVGDSDSHGYHDTRSFAAGSPARGGNHRATTYQWTEVLAALRPEALDLGPRTDSGIRGSVARVLRTLGASVRSPRKFDHLHNFAVSGQGCDDLMGGPSAQVPELLALMQGDPARWARGVVVVRIGINTFGKATELDRLARDPRDPAVTALIDRCVAQVASAVDRLAGASPTTRIVLVGVFDNRHWAAYLGRWKSPAEQANIAAGLDRFDAGLRRLVSGHPTRAFFDDRAWFASVWGGRDAQGAPAYRAVPFGPLRVTNTAGDAPSHATVADGHAGTAWNALWARALVDLMNRQFGLGVPPLTDAELASLLSRPVGR